MGDPHESERKECHLDLESLDHHIGKLPEVVESLVASCSLPDCFDHISLTPLPDQGRVVGLFELMREVLFPGYFSQAPFDHANLPYYLGQKVMELYQSLADQIGNAVRHDCRRYDMLCRECVESGREAALAFLGRLPDLRGVLAKDIVAARQGDPASSGYDEIIFSYPGLYAITAHRLAHELELLGVPLLPRIISEHAHTISGIDIHPAARVGESFFIDHGTGVVVGATCEIGDRVRIYQGVTLGALSLPADAGDSLRGKKRHPTIEDDVTIYAGATILGGDTVIGARSVIGGNVWLTDSVPPDTKVLLKKPELIYQGRRK